MLSESHKNFLGNTYYFYRNATRILTRNSSGSPRISSEFHNNFLRNTYYFIGVSPESQWNFISFPSECHQNFKIISSEIPNIPREFRQNLARISPETSEVRVRILSLTFDLRAPAFKSKLAVPRRSWSLISKCWTFGFCFGLEHTFAFSSFNL